MNSLSHQYCGAHDGGMGFPVFVVDVGEYVEQCLKNFSGLGVSLLGQSLAHDVAAGPEHGERGVFPFVDGIHRADGLICLFYPPQLA